MVISSGVTAATVGRIDCATAAVTRPAPVRKAATELIEGAPDLPLAPPMTSTCPKRPLLESAGRGRSAIVLELPAQVRPVADSTASAGEPMGATTMGPVFPARG